MLRNINSLSGLSGIYDDLESEYSKNNLTEIEKLEDLLNDEDNLDIFKIIELKKKIKNLNDIIEQKTKPKTVTISYYIHKLMKDYCKKNDLSIGEFVEECIYNEVYKESNKRYTLKITCDNFKEIQSVINNYLNKDNICWLNVENGNIFKNEPEDRENIVKYIGTSRIDGQIIVIYYKDTFPINRSIVESIQKIGNIEPKNTDIEMILNVEDHISNIEKSSVDKLFKQVYNDMELNEEINKIIKKRYSDFYDVVNLYKIDKEMDCIIKDNRSFDEIIQNLKSQYNIEEDDDLHTNIKKYKPVSYHILDEIEEDGKKKLNFKKIDD